MWARRARRLVATTIGEAAVLALVAVAAYRKGEKLYPMLAERYGALVPTLNHLEPEPSESVRRKRIPCTCMWGLAQPYRREVEDPCCGAHPPITSLDDLAEHLGLGPLD